jgi:hypothetical protein
MTQLLGGQIGLEDFLFAHCVGEEKLVKVRQRLFETFPSFFFLQYGATRASELTGCSSAPTPNLAFTHANQYLAQRLCCGLFSFAFVYIPMALWLSGPQIQGVRGEVMSELP